MKRQWQHLHDLAIVHRAHNAFVEAAFSPRMLRFGDQTAAIVCGCGMLVRLARAVSAASGGR